uniref:Uncharacterized protein n=1 Tax=Arundo donax TaxID=35708 RepID=A0A0A9GRK9_ARUDO
MWVDISPGFICLFVLSVSV